MAQLVAAPTGSSALFGGQRWQALLRAVAAHRPWLLVGAAALTGGLVGLLFSTARRGVWQRVLTLVIAPPLWGAVQAEVQRFVRLMLSGRLFEGHGGAPPAQPPVRPAPPAPPDPPDPPNAP